MVNKTLCFPDDCRGRANKTLFLPDHSRGRVNKTLFLPDHSRGRVFFYPPSKFQAMTGRSCANSVIVAVLTAIPIILAALTHLQ